MLPRREFWQGRPVLLTGHTGFKGAWLALWLRQLGARVHGFALDPPTEPHLFGAARVGALLASDTRADLADRAQLNAAVDRCQPELIVHLAAQSLVRAGYANPVGTFATNVLGTAHLLEAARRSQAVRAVLVVTTDKVYENRESLHAYCESDPLGGHDPYSASKAAAELVSGSYRVSFGSPARIATARSGNVIGGGDFAPERLMPDCLRAFEQRVPVRLRYPAALRPWQHVLEPLAGYLRLAELLHGDGAGRFARAWNFGPDASCDATAAQVARRVARLWGEDARVEDDSDPKHPHEAGLLRLDSRAARAALGWAPRWPLEEAIRRTVEWHRARARGEDPQALCLRQIDDYQSVAIS